jgi:hypothetical protein
VPNYNEADNDNESLNDSKEELTSNAQWVESKSKSGSSIYYYSPNATQRSAFS